MMMVCQSMRHFMVNIFLMLLQRNFHGLQILQIILWVVFFLMAWIIDKGKSSYMIANSTIGRSHYFTRGVQMVWFEDVFPKMKLEMFWGIVIHWMLEDILEFQRQHLRYYNLIFGGLLCLRILENMCLRVIDVKEWKIYQRNIRCLWKGFLKLRSSMFGE